MYRVISYFTDLQDGDHPYNAGDPFPRKGKEVSAERLAYLASNKTRRGFPVIEEVVEKKPAKTTKRTKKEV